VQRLVQKTATTTEEFDAALTMADQIIVKGNLPRANLCIVTA